MFFKRLPGCARFSSSNYLPSTPMKIKWLFFIFSTQCILRIQFLMQWSNYCCKIAGNILSHIHSTLWFFSAQNFSILFRSRSRLGWCVGWLVFLSSKETKKKTGEGSSVTRLGDFKKVFGENFPLKSRKKLLWLLFSEKLAAACLDLVKTETLWLRCTVVCLIRNLKILSNPASTKVADNTEKGSEKV